MEKITIFIADDHKLIRETWTLLLNADPRFKVIGETGEGEAAVEMVRALCPQIVIMDINLQGMNGIDATARIHEYAPDCKILGISLHTQPSYARKMLQVGAMGYLTKNSPSKEMFSALIEIWHGKKYICDEIKMILSDLVMDEKKESGGINTLSQREIEVIDHIRLGRSSREIADVLQVSKKTVEVHRYNIMRKLNIRNVASLVNYVNTYQLEIRERLAS
jgi:two-component system invasion response regulator UvrY